MNIGNNIDNTIMHKAQIRFKRDMGQEIKFNPYVTVNYSIPMMFSSIRWNLRQQLDDYRKRNR